MIDDVTRLRQRIGSDASASVDERLFRLRLAPRNEGIKDGKPESSCRRPLSRQPFLEAVAARHLDPLQESHRESVRRPAVVLRALPYSPRPRRRSSRRPSLARPFLEPASLHPLPHNPPPPVIPRKWPNLGQAPAEGRPRVSGSIPQKVAEPGAGLRSARDGKVPE